MKSKAIVALPTSASEKVIAHIKKELATSHQSIDFSYDMCDDISYPAAKSLDAVDLGNINGDRGASCIAMLDGINRTARRAFRSANY